MKNGKKIINLTLLTIFLFYGCAETEESAMQNQGMIEEVDISAVEYPKQVTIYETEFWEPDVQIVTDVFLQGEPTSIQKSDGTMLYDRQTDMFQRVLLSEDGEGMNYILNYPNLESDDVPLINRYDTSLSSMEFSVTKDIVKKPSKENPVYQESVKLVEDYMGRLGMPYYQIKAAAMVASEIEEAEGCLTYWQQYIDHIPISMIYIPETGQLSGTRVYNPGLSSEIRQLGTSGSELEILVAGGRILSWYGQATVVPIEKTGTYPVISPEKAYQPVLEICQKAGSTDMRLKNVELQYKSVEKDGNQMLFPVWVFAVATYHPLMEQHPITQGYIWDYYLVNAVTGDFFTDIDVE